MVLIKFPTLPKKGFFLGTVWLTTFVSGWRERYPKMWVLSKNVMTMCDALCLVFKNTNRYGFFFDDKQVFNLPNYFSENTDGFCTRQNNVFVCFPFTQPSISRSNIE